ncbi:hypothetical protein LX69_00479 [Breznakibacter xylanolyticus]|uniref:Uncharacterized protein n=1 Tax=Breznakibacter xylanolyticus TaxID=990 RepID=A0A2W7NIC4_9BACT|nr:DUF5320 domain-containing protein [Breznakibacter xylanolyticus]PZX20028.1 hypothetical protein LX69_00479 [Breznakibacter xylanolyticus]
MPGLNRRGPQGEGAMTGRRMGRCNPDNKGLSNDEIMSKRSSETPLRLHLGRGTGAGLGRGRSMGKGNGHGHGMR